MAMDMSTANIMAIDKRVPAADDDCMMISLEEGESKSEIEYYGN